MLVVSDCVRCPEKNYLSTASISVDPYDPAAIGNHPTITASIIKHFPSNGDHSPKKNRFPALSARFITGFRSPWSRRRRRRCCSFHGSHRISDSKESVRSLVQKYLGRNVAPSSKARRLFSKSPTDYPDTKEINWKRSLLPLVLYSSAPAGIGRC
ncbi:hypothetical protein GWI33_002693 [Rhynchophorus ferrugineus]|uniref:Uncharacterized protein n=1 Tax=Rhynchophorus ferrugineus TaxID=354439 RepID=A0A834LX66_RHYFE|nr:hypothetical protein GWI33_002693 [Rhynchophorus ferrugineus]